MKHKVATFAILLACLFSLPTLAENAPSSPLMKQLNNGNWLPEQEAQSLSNELYYQDAIQAYIQTLPLLNTIGLRDGSEEAFGKGYNVLPIWKERMDSRAVVPTPNGDVIYSMSYLDLKETGPLVIKAPANVIGMFTDFFQKTITDVGAIGPDRARGGSICCCRQTTTGQYPRAITRLNPQPIMYSSFSAPSWAKARVNPIPYRQLKMLKPPASTRSGMLKKMSNRCSSRMPAASA